MAKPLPGIAKAATWPTVATTIQGPIYGISEADPIVNTKIWGCQCSKFFLVFNRSARMSLYERELDLESERAETVDGVESGGKRERGCPGINHGVGVFRWKVTTLLLNGYSSSKGMNIWIRAYNLRLICPTLSSEGVA